ncbi:putative ribonuclease H-like domain-containing protein [Tanacetum coccineum]
MERIEAIRLFLAYASFKDFVVYQMDVKSAFLYGKIEEEVYVCQPPGFEDPDFPDRVYKVEKALYGLVKGDILLVQVYVDDIIFGFTKKSLCIEFEKMMHKKFQMSSIGERTFFLGLQVKQKEDGISISQDKYVTEILKKFGFTDVKTASTPMETQKPLLKDADGEDVDEHLYRSMIGSLMYLTSSRPDIMFAVCACARFQVNPKVSHLHAVKRIFRYLKGQPKLGLWYPKDSPFDLVAYTDSDYAGASLDRKSTTGGCQFLGCRLISWQCKKQTVVANSTTEAEYIAASNCCGQRIHYKKTYSDDQDSHRPECCRFAHKRYLEWNEKAAKDEIRFWDTVKAKSVNREVQLQALVDKKKVIITESTIRRDIQLEDAEGTDCLPNATIFKQLALMGKSKKKNTEVPQSSGSTDNVPDENVPTTSNDPLVSGEDRLKLTELMDLCTNLQKKVLDLEKAKTAQYSEITNLKKKVKKLERRNKSRTPRLKRLRKVGSTRRVESSNEASLGDQGRNDDNLMFDIGVLDEQKVEVEKVVSTTEVTTTTIIDELTLAQTLIEIKATKPKVRGVMIQEPSEFTTTTTTTTPAASKPS